MKIGWWVVPFILTNLKTLIKWLAGSDFYLEKFENFKKFKLEKLEKQNGKDPGKIGWLDPYTPKVRRQNMIKVL